MNELDQTGLPRAFGVEDGGVWEAGHPEARRSSFWALPHDLVQEVLEMVDI